MGKAEEHRISEKLEQLNIIVGKIANKLTGIISENMEKDSGQVKWWQVVTICSGLAGVFASLFMWSINQVGAVELRSTGRDEEIKTCIIDYIVPMKEDIAAIKASLDIRK